jgi:hypothetical protein
MRGPALEQRAALLAFKDENVFGVFVKKGWLFQIPPSIMHTIVPEDMKAKSLPMEISLAPRFARCHFTQYPSQFHLWDSERCRS